MPQGSKVAKAEAALKARYGTKSPQAQRIVYGRLNEIGFMRGNKPTKKGLAKAK